MDECMPLSGDGSNALEHALRQHTRDACVTWTEMTGCMERELYITYNIADGGKWHVTSYKPDIVTRGAELMRVMEAHIAMWLIQSDLNVLRGRITHQPYNKEDDA